MKDNKLSVIITEHINTTYNLFRRTRMSKLLETGPSPRGWHRLQNMLECPQKWSYRYNLGMKPSIPAIALMKGSLMHLALAHHYMRKQDADNGIETEWLDPFDAIDLKCQQEPDFVDAKNVVQKGMEFYLDHWQFEDQRWKVLEVEKLAYATIDDPVELAEDGTPKRYLLTGRFDMILENAAGDVYVVDHKTTSRLTKSHEQFYAMSGQLLGYEYMARKIFGDRLRGVMLNLVQLGTKNKCERLVIPPRPFLSSQFEQTVIDAERRIAQLDKSGRDALEYPKAMNELTCFTRYGACAFMDTCKYGVTDLG